MPALPQKLLLLAIALALAIGCKPEIGDDCQLSTDCSAQGDRLCDITAPGGYCTVFNCEPGNCPEDESLCVQFGSQRSPVPACQDLQSPSPYARAFCMATCEDNDDCRDDYECANLSEQENKWGAILIDRDRGDRACMVRVIPLKPEIDGPENFGDVCHAELPSAEPEPQPEPEPAAGGQGPGTTPSAGAGPDAGAGGGG
jgi:hypothetical protein